MSGERGPWPKPKDLTGSTLLRYKGTLYRIEGTGHSITTMVSRIKAGKAPQIDDPR